MAGAGVVALVGTVGAPVALAAKAPPLPVSGASATITMQDGLTANGVAVKPFRVQLTVTGISFPTREGGDQAQPGNVFVHITVRVTNLAGASRVIPFNGSEIDTMAMGISHAVPGNGVADSVCTPPALDGLRTDQQVSDAVTAQWCVVSTSVETVLVRPHRSKAVTFGEQVVSRTDAQPANFALIYSPSDAARPTILPVGPGAVPTTSPG